MLILNDCITNNWRSLITKSKKHTEKKYNTNTNHNKKKILIIPSATLYEQSKQDQWSVFRFFSRPFTFTTIDPVLWTRNRILQLDCAMHTCKNKCKPADYRSLDFDCFPWLLRFNNRRLLERPQVCVSGVFSRRFRFFDFGKNSSLPHDTLKPLTSYSLPKQTPTY